MIQWLRCKWLGHDWKWFTGISYGPGQSGGFGVRWYGGWCVYRFKCTRCQKMKQYDFDGRDLDHTDGKDGEIQELRKMAGLK